MPKVAQTVNGVDVTKMNETIAAVKETPAIARFKFSAKNKWLDGAHNRSTIAEYSGALETFHRERPFVLENDEAPVLLGEDRAPNPVENLLHALAGCITTTMVYHSAARGLVIDELETSFEGDIDLHGFLGLRDDVRPGYQQIRVNVRIKGDLTDEQIQDIAKLAEQFSPVFDTLTKGTNIMVKATRK